MKGPFSFVQKLKSHASQIVIFILITVLAALIFSITRTPEYETRARVLVIQRQTTPDAFAASQAADYVASLLQEGITSDSFYNTVVQKDTTLRSSLSSDITKRRKQWAKKVTTSLVSEKGILVINAYDANKESAQKLGELVVSTLISTGTLYHGAGDTVVLRLLDAPVTSLNPARPNIPLNLFAGLVVGLGMSFAYIVLVSDRSETDKDAEGAVYSEIPQPAPSFYPGRLVPTPAALEDVPESQETLPDSRSYSEPASLPEIPWAPEHQERLESTEPYTEPEVAHEVVTPLQYEASIQEVASEPAMPAPVALQEAPAEIPLVQEPLEQKPLPNSNAETSIQKWMQRR